MSFCSNVYKYWIWRFENSNLISLAIGSPGRESVDGAVNTAALIAALLLTIPYSTMGNFGPDYFNWLEVNLMLCNPVEINEATPNKVLNDFKNWLISSMIPSVYVIFTCMLYYISRPFEDKKFDGWWIRGKYVVLTQIIGNIISGYGVWYTLELSFMYYMNGDDQLCDSSKDTYFKTAGFNG